MLPAIAMTRRKQHFTLTSRLGPLLGRDSELEVAQRLLLDQDVHLLTVTGPGGVGKSRLALELAASLDHAFPNGVHAIDMSAVRDSGLLLTAVASAFGLRHASPRHALEQFKRHVDPQRVLLVLDNIEQVQDVAAQVDRLLSSCPGLVVLATSREPVRLRAERRLPLGPLMLPDPRRSAREQAAAPAPTVALFDQRARAVRPHFALTEHNALMVGEICARLDGLPLAIELAAARMSVLTVEGVLARLQQRLPLLQWRMADAPERHRALRTTFSWSYDLLDDPDQRFFRALGAFPGSFNIEASSAVTQLPDTIAAVDALQRLVEKSLVDVIQLETGESRFRLLETIREFALDCLATAGELEDTRRRHALYFLRIAEQTSTGPLSADGLADFARLDQDHGNMLAALDWTEATGSSDLELQLAAALGRFWWLRGYAALGRFRLEQALEHGSASPSEERAEGLLWCAVLTFWDGHDARALSLLHDATEVRRKLGNHVRMAWVLVALAYVALYRADYDRASTAAAEAISLTQGATGDFAAGVALQYLGLAELLQSRPERAAGLLKDSLQLLRKVGDIRYLVTALTSCAIVEMVRGQLEDCARLLSEALVRCRVVEELRSRHYALTTAAQLIALSGNVALASRVLSALDVHYPPAVLPLAVPEVAVTRLLLRFAAPAEYEEESNPPSVLELVEECRAALAITAQSTTSPARSTSDSLDSPYLSSRQREVLQLLREGLSNTEIARRLVISPRTARFHVASILGRLGATNRTHAVALALERRQAGR